MAHSARKTIPTRFEIVPNDETNPPTSDSSLAAADAAEGEGVFRKCAACHKLDGSNAVGPHLDGVGMSSDKRHIPSVASVWKLQHGSDENGNARWDVG
mgnify:CR=1 FL=1